MQAMAKTKKLIKSNRDVAIIYLLLGIFIVVSACINENFLTPKNLMNIFVSSVPLIIIAYAQTITIVVGCVDLSLGVTVSLVTTICATMMTRSIVLGLLFAVLAGVVVGVVNGVLVAKFNIQALIATLCTSLVIGGAALGILDKPGGSMPKEFAKAVSSDGALFLIFLAVTVVLIVVLTKTRFGKSVYAVGGNPNSAYNAGVNVDKVKISVFIVAGILAAVAGIVMACQVRSGDPTAGTPLTLKALTAAVIGGASFAGVMIFAIINNVLNLIGVSTFYQFIAQGLLLIVAIAITSKRK